MADIYRIGAAAASKPREEDLVGERDSITDRLLGGLAKGDTQSFNKPEQLVNASHHTVTYVDYPVYQWPEITPTAQQRTGSGVAPVLRPPEITNANDPTLYSIYFRWPRIGGTKSLLGMFIRSRPKGSVLWRTNIDYREFTDQIDQYGPLNDNVRDLYVEELSPSTIDEYQIATRYTWTPDPHYEFLSEIFDGAEFPRTQPIFVAELAQSGSFKTSQRNIAHQNLFEYAVFGEIDLIEGEDHKCIGHAFGEGVDRGNNRFYAKFAETLLPQDEDEQLTADANGKMRVHAGSFFTYADDVEGIIVID